MIMTFEGFSSFIEKFEIIVTDSLNDYDIDGWDEDRLTGSLLKTIKSKSTFFKKVNETTICHFNFEAYRLKGKEESKNGDIAFLVRVHTGIDKYFDGVAFYEAKKVYYKDGQCNNIGAAKSEQLHRLDKNSNASNVLIYNVQDSNRGFTADIRSMPTKLFNKLVESIHGPDFKHGPSVQLLDYGKNFVYPFLDTFIGFHLDFNPNVIDPILDSITKRKNDHTLPSYNDLTQASYFVPVDCYSADLEESIKDEHKLTKLELIPSLVNIMPPAYKSKKQTES